jgi:anthranilate/para-aminobenzoate synthase component I
MDKNHDLERECKQSLNSFFDRHPDDTLRARSLKALRFLMADAGTLSGNPAAWAAGIVYAVANFDRQPCGVPGLLNQELEQFFGVTMRTIRKRAEEVK